MKIHIDVEKTLGKLAFIKVEELKDYLSKETVGSKIIAVSLNEYDKVSIKINKPVSEFQYLKKDDIIKIIEPEITPYVSNGYVALSIKGQSISLVKDKVSLPTIS